MATLLSAWSRIFNIKTHYIAVNILISGLGFSRNLIFMKVFGLGDLGQVALMQTIVMMVGFFQFGLVNGGYRIYSLGDKKQNESINTVLFSFFLLLTLVALLLGLSGCFDWVGAKIKPETMMIGVAAGVVTLVATWVNNALIGDGKLLASNYINLSAVVISLVFGILSFKFGLWSALLSMFIQPAWVVLLVLILHSEIRPKRIQLDLNLIKQILELGFIPFIAGILFLLNFQVERWSIIYVLGPEQLGQFYIVMLYQTIFTLVPASLLNLYFPRTIRAFEESRHGDFICLVKRHTFELMAYIGSAVLVTVVFLSWMLNNYFIKYKGTEYLVYYVIPGLVAITLCDPASLVFNSAKRLRPLLIYGLITLLLTTLLLWVVYYFGCFTLKSVAIVKSLANIGSFIYLISVFIMFNKRYSGKEGS